MKKKLFAVFLVLIMLLGMLPHAVFAADDGVVARIGDVTYTDLQEAFDAAQDQEGVTVELLNDYTATDKLFGRHTGILDLGGHTLDLDSLNQAFTVYNNQGGSADLTIKNGKIVGNGEYPLMVYFSNALTLEDCKIEFTNIRNYYGIYVLGSLTLSEGADVYVTGPKAGVPAVCLYDKDSSVVIDGGTITAESSLSGKDSYCVYMPWGGTTELKSGKLIGNGYTTGVFLSEDPDTGDNSVFKMTGGTIENCATAGLLYDKTTFTMTGGEITDCGTAFSGWGTNLTQYTTINLGGSAKVTSRDVAIYQPQNGEINISDNAYLEGASAIGIKSGTINISGGTLRAVSEYDQDPGVRSSGMNLDGSTIVIDGQGDGYYGNVKVNISGGELISDNGHNISITRATAEKPPVVTATEGTFKSAENTFRMTDDEYKAHNATITVSGGTVLKNGKADLSVEFNSEDHFDDAGYLAGEYLTVDRTTGEVGNIKLTALEAFGGTLEIEPETLSEDVMSFTVTAVPQTADYSLVSLTFIDDDGKTVTIMNDGTVTGDGSDCIKVSGSDGVFTVTSHCHLTVNPAFVLADSNAVIETPVITVDTSKVDGLEDEHLENTGVVLPQDDLENILNEVSGKTAADDARQALEEAGILESDSQDDVYLQIATEIKVEVLEYDDQPNTPNVLKLEITPYYHVYATTSPSTPVVIGEEVGEDFVLIDSSEYRISGTDLNIPMTIPFTEKFASVNSLISIEHEHTDLNGKTHNYFGSARVREDNTIVFRNRHGFSIFTFTVDTTAGLDDLQVKDSKTGEVFDLDPEFDTDEYEYQVTVPNEVESVQLQPTVDVEDIIITVNGVVVKSGDWSDGIPLKEGKNVITVKVSDGDGESTLNDGEYTIVIYRKSAETTSTTDVSNTAPDVSTTNPDVTTTAPNVTTTAPNVTTTAPNVTTTAP
ncbi:MAG: cadherin-like beta sandwich domain-containing protein, partial [Eubacterium sp.]|nr:cadherin-like beta sandwich domain-containing protein [Eubacterium sp.]